MRKGQKCPTCGMIYTDSHHRDFTELYYLTDKLSKIERKYRRKRDINRYHALERKLDIWGIKKKTGSSR